MQYAPRTGNIASHLPPRPGREADPRRPPPRRRAAEGALQWRPLFYDRLNGVMLLTPQEQKAVGRILAACGAAEPVEFDAYTELFDFSLRLTSDELVKRQEV